MDNFARKKQRASSQKLHAQSVQAQLQLGLRLAARDSQIKLRGLWLQIVLPAAGQPGRGHCC